MAGIRIVFRLEKCYAFNQEVDIRVAGIRGRDRTGSINRLPSSLPVVFYICSHGEANIISDRRKSR